MIEYRSVSDLNSVILRNLARVPRDIDVVVGVPRSGLLAASMLALHLNLPLTDVEGLVAGRVLAGGMRAKAHPTTLTSAKRLKALVLDDSICGGTQMAQVRKRLESAQTPHEIIYGAVYGSREGSRQVDFCFELLPTRRLFEWNIMHGWAPKISCIDIDGVLCVDPTDEENDDGPRYVEFLKNAAPLMLPTGPVGWLVTCRLEKYRTLTEDWLRRHNVAYGELIMMGFASKAERIASGSYGKFKAEAFARTDAELFIESSAAQASEIARRAGKQVFCVETARMEYPSAFPKTLDAARSRTRENYLKLCRVAAKLAAAPRKARRILCRWR